MNDTKDSVTGALQPVEWPVMPPSKGQSPVLFDDGYDEGWAKCLEACKAALAATKQENNMTIFALEQCVENGVDLNISDAESALAELNTLRAQLAEAQKNEKRYLWMRDKETSEGWDIIGRSGTPDQIDAAIDAAKGESNGIR